MMKDKFARNSASGGLFSFAVILFLLLSISGCQKKYNEEYIKWGEQTNSNATELLEKNGIPCKIKDGIIYIPEDAYDKSINCCS